LKFQIRKVRDGQESDIEFSVNTQEKLSVLDVLQDARAKEPDLAFRYGCRNRLCGVCTVNVNGKPKLACRTPARDGQRFEPAVGLPVLQDLVVLRDGINQQLHSRLPQPRTSTDDSSEYDALGRCIECYACLDSCPMHARNDPNEIPENGYENGNPYSLLRIQRVATHPGTTEQEKYQAKQIALELGLDDCTSCDGCTCGVGIDLMADVINPLLEAG